MYKSRTLAGEAIRSGKVRINGESFKASHFVKVGESYTLSIGHQKKIIEVSGLVAKRGSFEQAQKFYIDRSPPPEKSEAPHPSVFLTNVRRDKGSGRPTKKDRRDMEDFGR